MTLQLGHVLSQKCHVIEKVGCFCEGLGALVSLSASSVGFFIFSSFYKLFLLLYIFSGDLSSLPYRHALYGVLSFPPPFRKPHPISFCQPDW